MIKNLQVVRYSNWYIILALLFVVASLILLFTAGLKLGIEFTGGTLWRFSGGEGMTLETVKQVFEEELEIKDARLTFSPTDGSYLARFPVIDESAHQRNLSLLENSFPGFSELSFESIGPSIGDDLKRNAVQAIILGLIGISLYIAFAFRQVSRPISSWKYGLVTLGTLFHDVIIAAGFLSLAGLLWGVEIDANFIVAMLVIAGFSVHDTIVVFDRIRENLIVERNRSDFGTIIDSSISQTVARSLNTSVTLILVLIALLIIGPSTLQFFIAALLVGTTMGTYSSIFVASPLLLKWERRRNGGHKT
ncbi:MAG: protein translocase subunit SecF [Anaplasmataceae bacterium]|nr:protein translocase subunit SecF [Anaplasmataceae bacterium]